MELKLDDPIVVSESAAGKLLIVTLSLSCRRSIDEIWRGDFAITH
jgi:hypothetical protein